MAKQAPGFKVPVHILAYSILFSPAFIFLAYYDRYGKQEEELEQELQEKYGDNIRKSQAGNKNMAAFFDHAIRNPDGKVDDQLDSVLKAGKGAMKRHYAVDDKLYGTAEGVAERKRMEIELKRQKVERKKRKAAGPKKAQRVVKKEEAAAAPRKTIEVDAKQVAAVTVLAAAAALVGFLAGGSRR